MSDLNIDCIVRKDMSRHDFLSELKKAKNNKELLISLMARIDSEKREVKSTLSQISSEPESALSRGKNRQVYIRKLKDRMSTLTTNRETVRQNISHFKKVKNDGFTIPSNNNFAIAFMEAAELILDEELFNEIEVRAGVILTSKGSKNI
jgi:predicted nuclease with TOPRIM domain